MTPNTISNPLRSRFRQRLRSTLAATLAMTSLASIPSATADILNAWNTNGLSGITPDGFQSQIVGTNMLVSELSRGPGLTATSLANGFAASGWDSATLDEDSYFEFFVEAEPGFTASLDSIEYRTRRTGTGPTFLLWAYSLDGENFEFIGGDIAYNNTTDAFVQEPIILSGIGDLQDQENRITFRLYGWGASASGGTLAFGRSGAGNNDLVVNGPAGPGLPNPTLGAPSIADITETSAVASATFEPNDADDFTEYGFIIAENSVNPNPMLGDGDVTVFDFDTLPVPSPITADLTGLMAGTEYAVRAYVIYDAGAETEYSDLTIFTTEAPDTTGPVPVAFVPSSGAANVSLDTLDLSIIFDEEIFIVGEDFIEIRRVADDSLFEAIDPLDFFSVSPGDPEEMILFLFELFEPGTEYYVSVPAGMVEDQFGNPSLAFGEPTSDIPWTFTTFAPIVLEDGIPYEQDFSGFTGVIDAPANLPAGWFASGPALNYRGDWGDGFLSGFRGDASVLGYQHTSGTGTLVKGLTLVNGTGAEITDLVISYRGRVERIDETRLPEYTVEVDGNVVAALAYSTGEGDNVLKQTSVSGLSIPAGAEFTITWTSDFVPEGGGSRRQIGISEFSVTNSSAILPPTIGAISLSPGSLTDSSFEITGTVLGDGGAVVTERGFLIAETVENDQPEIGGTGVTVVVDPDAGLGSFANVFMGLTPDTAYSVRAYATNAEGTAYSSVLGITTNLPLPSLVTVYEQSFNGFDGTLPAGWTALSSAGANAYQGAWGSGTAGGFRGGVSDPGVLGYQHTGTTGVLTVSLELRNDTGDTLKQLFVSYLGRVERATQGRTPFWAVAIDGVEVPELTYSTAGGVDELVEFTITGLNIPAGESFTLTWSSTIGAGSGSNRQIGIADVFVEAIISDVDIPVFSLAAGTYFEDQTVFITNFGSYDPTVEVRYTLDGSDPAEGFGLVYNDTTGIPLADGNGPVELRAIAVDTDTSLFSLLAVRTFNFPVNVPDVAAFRNGMPGTLYRITSEVVVLHRDGFRNRHYVRDGSGSLTIWDESSLLTTQYALGDGVTGLVGTRNSANNGAIITLNAATDAGEPTSIGNPVEPVLVNINALDLSFTGNLVRINNVSFDTLGSFANGANYTISNASGSTVVRTDFFNVDYIGGLIPSEPVDLVVIVGGFGGNPQITPRSSADFLPATPPSQDDFAAWIAGFPGVGSLTGPFDTPAGDGVPNILKHVLGLAPDVAVTGALVTTSDAGPGEITFVHTRIKPAALASDAIFAYEWSTNLADWATDGATLGGVTVNFGQQTVLDSSAPAFDLVEVTASVTEGSADRLFIRLAADVEAAAE